MSGFMSLPLELRNMIYNYVIEEGDKDTNVDQNPDLWPIAHRLDIMRTCRTIRIEAARVFYRHVKFRFHVMSATKSLPTLSQERVDLMQNIHIVLGSNIEKLPGSLTFLRLFAGSTIIRGECRVELDMAQPHHVEATVPALHLLKEFTGFKIVTVEMVSDAGNFEMWHKCLNHAKAGHVWRQGTKELERSLGTAVNITDYDFRYLEFWPRDYLKQRAWFSSRC